ncbi:unnamed protein product [Cylicocyclus nassatus]|uniref:DNA helicase Pif1-like 2B domain-containing protein n=1 Tax=Cylicocyclus nassatus TaxID=53992 RepID=A0AA36H873_CYLNA|nr:unnamed protein product [Cylicocyclus nassatus]
MGAEEKQYTRWLLSVGTGDNFYSDDNILLPSSMCMTTEDDVIEWIYTPELLNDSSMLARVALLTVRNCDVEELNIKVLEKLAGDTVDLVGIDTPSVEEDGLHGLPCDNAEYFHYIMPASLPPYILRIKPGSIVMLLRNVDVSSQLCNGTRLVVISFHNENKLLRCKNLTNGEDAYIHRMNLDYTNEKTGVVKGPQHCFTTVIAVLCPYYGLTLCFYRTSATRKRSAYDDLKALVNHSGSLS